MPASAIKYKVSPAANVTVPDGSTPPKSDGAAACAPLPLTDHFTLCGALPALPTLPTRRSSDLPLPPSAFTASVAAIDTAETSSFRIVPTADPVPSVSPDDGLEIRSAHV